MTGTEENMEPAEFLCGLRRRHYNDTGLHEQ